MRGGGGGIKYIEVYCVIAFTEYFSCHLENL